MSDLSSLQRHSIKSLYVKFKKILYKNSSIHIFWLFTLVWFRHILNKMTYRYLSFIRLRSLHSVGKWQISSRQMGDSGHLKDESLVNKVLMRLGMLIKLSSIWDRSVTKKWFSFLSPMANTETADCSLGHAWISILFFLLTISDFSCVI